MNVNSGTRVKYSLDMAANQLKNESGRKLQAVSYDHGKMVFIINGVECRKELVPGWLLDRVDALAKKYGLAQWNWYSDPVSEKDTEERVSNPTLKSVWSQLNGVLGEKIVALRIAKLDDSRRGQVQFLMGEHAEIVAPADLMLMPYRFAKANHEQHSNAKQVKELAEQLVVMFAKAVARREKMQLAPNKLEIERWGDRLPLTVAFKTVSKEVLHLPSAASEKKAAEKAAAKTPRVTHTQHISVNVADL